MEDLWEWQLGVQSAQSFLVFFRNGYTGGNSNIFYVHPYFGEDEPILTHIFSTGLKPPTSRRIPRVPKKNPDGKN